jgi:hypothetical protein
MRAVYSEDMEVGDMILIDKGEDSTNRFCCIKVDSVEYDGSVVCNQIDISPNIDDQYIVIDN